MIKVEKNDLAVVAELIVYPCLMVSLKGTVVLFTEYKVGTLVHPRPTTKRPVGHHSTSWSMDLFKLYKGSINLSNEV